MPVNEQCKNRAAVSALMITKHYDDKSNRLSVMCSVCMAKKDQQ